MSTNACVYSLAVKVSSELDKITPNNVVKRSVNAILGMGGGGGGDSNMIQYRFVYLVNPCSNLGFSVQSSWPN